MKNFVARTLSRCFGRHSKTARSKPIQGSFRPGVEALEERAMMAVASRGDTFGYTLAPLTINGTEAADVVVVKKAADSLKMEVFVNNASRGQFDPALTRGFKINGLGGNDRFVLEYPFDIKQITIDGGVGSNTLVDARPFGGQWQVTGVNAGKLSSNIQFVRMPNLTGGAFNDSFALATAGQITGTIHGGGGKNELSAALGANGTVWVNAFEGGNVINRVGVLRGIQSFVGAGVGATIQAGNTTNVWDLTADTGRISSFTTGGTKTGGGITTIEFSRFDSLFGGASGDTFKIGDDTPFRAPRPVPITLIHGLGGVNSLNFSAVTQDLYVNLSKNLTTFMRYERDAVEQSFNMYNFTNVIGGSGHDIIVGNNAANRLDGGAGNDVLIGRDGADVLIGGSGNDSLIGGFTDFDLNPAALRGYVRHEVGGYTDRYGVVHPPRVINRVHAQPLFFDNYVRADRFKDTLLGGSGNDTFYVWAPAGGLFNDAFDGVAGDSWTYDIKPPF